MKLLFVGKTNFQYNRDLILLNGLKKREDVSLDILQIKGRNWSTFKEIRKRSSDVDFVVIPTFRHKDVLYIKMASKVPIVFDPLISKYMTRVIDYGVKWKGPHKYLVDWMSFYWPDLLIWDTNAHLEFIRKKYNLNKPMAYVYIGVDTSLFYPIEKAKRNIITVGFYGSFNPLQGIDKIVKAASLLKNESHIDFKIIGSGSTFNKVKQLAEELDTTNVKFLGNVPYGELNAAINTFDICLGVFGDSLKTDVVIPNKIFHYAAAGKCIITKDTQAIREVFNNSKNIILTSNSPQDIAAAIMKYVRDAERRKKIGESAFELISRDYNEVQVAGKFIDFLNANI